ncbi:MAG: hypothetical protein PVJ82_07930, partial [Desulfobacteraceae bacterium]
VSKTGETRDLKIGMAIRYMIASNHSAASFTKKWFQNFRSGPRARQSKAHSLELIAHRKEDFNPLDYQLSAMNYQLICM